MLNQMDDNELGLNMLNLDSTKSIVGEDNSVKKLLEQARKYEEKKSATIPEIDNSFYTSSLNFSKDDFEEANNIVTKKKSKKILLKILFFIGLLIVTGLIIFGVYYLIK